MNYKEITNAVNYFGAKSLNCATEIIKEFQEYSKYESYLSNVGIFWMMGKSVMTISNNEYVYLRKNLSSQQYIVKLKTPENFPNCSYNELLKFSSQIIENYNMNFAKF